MCVSSKEFLIFAGLIPFFFFFPLYQVNMSEMLVTCVALRESREGRIFSNKIPVVTLIRVQLLRRPDVLKRETMRRKQAI